MRQFIAQLLILSVLAINMTWAMDDCSPQYSHDPSGWVQSDDFPSDNQGDSVRDVPCVGWLHLVAIPPGTQYDDFPFSHQQVARTETSFHSFDNRPLVRPPLHFICCTGFPKFNLAASKPAKAAAA